MKPKYQQFEFLNHVSKLERREMAADLIGQVLEGPSREQIEAELLSGKIVALNPPDLRSGSLAAFKKSQKKASKNG